MMELVKAIAVIFISSYIIMVLLLYVRQDSMIFAGAYVLKTKVDEAHNISKDTAEYIFIISDGTKLYGSIIDHSCDTLVIYFGGNAENVTNMISNLGKFENIDAVSLNYRGVGKSEGVPSQDKLYSDALEVYDNFKDRYKNIIVVGRSLGSAVASYVGSKRDVSSMILITPFDSITNVAKEIYPIFPIKMLLKYPLDLKETVKDIKIPVDILMVEGDKVISNKHTLNLKKNIENLKSFEVVNNSGHNKIMEDKRLYDFILESLK